VKDDSENDSNISKYKKELEELSFVDGGHLRNYKAEGVSWLIANHVNKRSSILADEMG
jgi:SNF2 family DNA or RNA helicase